MLQQFLGVCLNLLTVVKRLSFLNRQNYIVCQWIKSLQRVIPKTGFSSSKCTALYQITKRECSPMSSISAYGMICLIS